MRKHWFALPVLIALATPLLAQLEYANAKTKAECTKYAQTPLPAEAALIPAPALWPDCTSYKLYSGIGTRVDFEAARRCAWQERLASQAGLAPRYTLASVLGGAAMLTQIYANGNGVEQNLPLAIRLTCEAGGAGAEIEGRTEHLETLSTHPPSPGTKFKFCDDITSGMMDGFCTSYDAEVADQSRTNALSDLSSNWSGPQQAMLAELEKALDAYAEAHGKGELDTSGTSHGAQSIRSEQSLRNSFLASIQSFENGNLPRHSTAEAQQADSELNRTYNKTIRDAEAAKSNPGAIQPEGIRTAERAWLKYRDLWIEFAKLRYPSVTAESWLTLLTKDRIATIQGGPCELDPDSSQCEKQDTQAPRPLP